ncbi:MAG: hypothetical protein H6716_08090 [Polyangiaceae bacterium]|nr:hypothetical protein [Polyangiaceae bacterium]
MKIPMMRLSVFGVCLGCGLFVACGGDDGGGGTGGSGAQGGVGGVAGAGGSTAGVGGDAGNAGNAGTAGAAGGGMGGTAGVGGVAGSGGNAGTGGNPAGELLADLGQSVWHGLQTRNGVERAYELSFDADQTLWAEVQNPFGPARKREMRVFSVGSDGASVSTTVITPQGWPVPQNNGEKKDYTVTVVDGSPRQLVIERDGATETYDEGPYPEPQTGLTAFVRVFPSSGAVYDAFCGKGTLELQPDRLPIWDFARDNSLEQELGSDIVAGVPLDTWSDPSGNNQFAVRNVPGFDQLGGTELSDQFNFIVTYWGTLTHAGGNIALREQNDQVQDALWAWLGDGVGSNNTNDLFLEVHSLAGADLTPDEPSASFAAGSVDFEAMVLRCNDAITKQIDVQVRFGNGAWTLVGNAPTTPLINDSLFPPAL